MSNIIVLDTGVLGMLVHPTETGEPRECKTWVRQLVLRGASVSVPENTRLRYVPITTDAMLKAAELWAEARSAGKPTADDKALDGDAILAAQSVLLSEAGNEVIVATTNIGHLSRFVDARSWRDIP